MAIQVQLGAVPEVNATLGNVTVASGGISTETDPTVPEWAKQPEKPTYTASDVGAIAEQQGTANAGKVLTVGADGVVVPGEAGGAAGDYIPVPTTATVGQTIKVSAVDETGKPTAWEAVDMAGGGADDWDYESEFSTSEAIASYELTEFEDGQSLALKECEVYARFDTEASMGINITYGINSTTTPAVHLNGGSYSDKDKCAYSTARVNDRGLLIRTDAFGGVAQYFNYNSELTANMIRTIFPFFHNEQTAISDATCINKIAVSPASGTMNNVTVIVRGKRL